MHRDSKGSLGFSMILVFGALAGALALSACGGGGGGSASNEDVAAGQKAFVATCATCHGKDGHGMPRLGKDLHNNEFTKSKSDAELVEFIKMGRPATHPDNTRGVDMPPRGGNPAITDDQIRQIVVYLRTLK